KSSTKIQYIQKRSRARKVTKGCRVSRGRWMKTFPATWNRAMEVTSPRDPRTTREVRIQTKTAEMYRMITMRIMERAGRHGTDAAVPHKRHHGLGEFGIAGNVHRRAAVEEAPSLKHA
ncbi:hypothetical protein GOODEAATRI_028550, partial [Goodea atripinnis]